MRDESWHRKRSLSGQVDFYGLSGDCLAIVLNGNTYGTAFAIKINDQVIIHHFGFHAGAIGEINVEGIGIWEIGQLSKY